MSDPNDRERKLELLIGRTLAELPPRRAPRSLQVNVLNEIERCAARTGFMRWPLLGRVAFVVACLGLAKLSLEATAWSASHMHHALNVIPFNWVAGALGLAGILYAALFGLGALAYRALSIER